ncbi:hypothetical protein K0M31_000577, partial [Melipona bicolor]
MPRGQADFTFESRSRRGETRPATVSPSSIEPQDRGETEAAGQKKTNAIRVHEIFADAINYPRPSVASATGERGNGGGVEGWRGGGVEGGRGSERAMGTPRWPRRKSSHPQKGSGALEMKGRMDVPRQVQET